MTLAWRNRDGVRQRFIHADVITPEAHRNWFDRYLQKPDDLVLIALEPQGDQPFGQVAIYGIDPVHREAEVGRFVVAPEHERQGKMRRALQCLLRLAHTRLGLRSVFLSVRSDNERAIALYSLLGFVETGRQGGIVDMRADLAAWGAPGEE